MDQITLRKPDDWHLHLRDGNALASVLPYSAAQFRRAIIMPNLQPPVTTTEKAKAYRAFILENLPKTASFDPLMTLYLTDNTTPEEIQKAKDSQIVYACKLYPAGATTNSAAGVTAISKVMKTLERMQKVGLPLLMHGEVTDPNVDIFDREAVFIERVLTPLRRDLPELKIVFEHITTKEAAIYVSEANDFLGATITPQHLLLNRNAIFAGGICPHHYCLPILKREENRLALVKAATSGNKHFFIGTDSAPHPKERKEASCGCAGCFSAMCAIELYASVFEEQKALDRLEAFASVNGATFYGLPLNEEKITLVKKEWKIPKEVDFGDSKVVPLLAEMSLFWQKV